MKLRSLFFIVLFAGLLLCGSSCDNSDGYSLDKFRISVATVVDEGQNTYSFTLDDGTRLWPTNLRPENPHNFNERVFLNYTLLSGSLDGYDHYIRVNDINNILTKDIVELTSDNSDEIGNDPIRIKDIWAGGGFMNIYFLFNYGGVQPHAINLVTTGDNDDDVIQMEFRHNAFGSTNTRLYEGFVCFDLKPFQRIDTDQVKINVKVKDFDEDKEFEVIYQYRVPIIEPLAIPIASSDKYY